jgi:hypothetical protein
VLKVDGKGHVSTIAGELRQKGDEGDGGPAENVARRQASPDPSSFYTTRHPMTIPVPLASSPLVVMLVLVLAGELRFRQTPRRLLARSSRRRQMLVDERRPARFRSSRRERVIDDRRAVGCSRCRG